jgi:eukaryotic-like serine/threonine-protein kinase
VSLAAGTKLGPYEIISPLGAGGMGEVYRAQDTRLERTVAIKVLPAGLAADPEFRQRFEREARSISSLDHPNICALYDVGEAPAVQGDGSGPRQRDPSPLSYLVMQYLEGETLAERLARGAMPVADALRVGIEIAGALDAAHRSGIVHRDLKPGNVMLTKTGARLLDFGLAKAGGLTAVSGAAATALATSPLPTSASPPLTAQGTILGTFQYMAPEQIDGEEADARTDIFAFGAVLYEMVTGRRAFSGKTQASLIGAIMKDVPPPATSIAAAVPPPLDRVIARCLAKDPDDRWQTARDLRSELAWIAEGREGSHEPGGVGAQAPATTSVNRERTAITLVGIPALVGLLAALGTWVAMRPSAVTTPRVEFSVPLPPDAPARRGSGAGVAISPDGKLLVYVADPVGSQTSMLYLRRLDTVGARPIAGTEGGFAPFFSPDSLSIGFITDEHVMRVPVAGGRPTSITAKGPWARATWMPDGTIVLGTSLVFAPGALGRVPATGGDATPLTTLGADERVHQLPRALPDGRHLLFSVHNEAGGQLAVTSLDSGTYRLLGMSGSDPRYIAPGALIFARDGALFQAPFDASRLEITGPEVSVLPEAHVYISGLGISIALLDVDSAGNLAYLPSLASRNRRLAWIDASGREDPLGFELALYSAPRISPDGRRFVVGVDTGGGVRRIRVVDFARGLPLDLDANGRRPLWGPGGTITFVTEPANTRDGDLARVPADNSAPPEVLVANDSQSDFEPDDWAPDGRRLLFSSSALARSRGFTDRNLIVLAEGAAPRAILDSAADEFGARISPDGKWMAYQSTSSGRTRVYVRPFDAPGGTQTVSGEGGSDPVWARDGRALYFLENGAMMKAAVQTSPFAIGTASVMFKLPAPADGFDVAPDGRFLVTLESATSAADELHVVLGWKPRIGGT